MESRSGKCLGRKRYALGPRQRTSGLPLVSEARQCTWCRACVPVNTRVTRTGIACCVIPWTGPLRGLARVLFCNYLLIGELSCATYADPAKCGVLSHPNQPIPKLCVPFTLYDTLCPSYDLPFIRCGLLALANQLTRCPSRDTSSVSVPLNPFNF